MMQTPSLSPPYTHWERGALAERTRQEETPTVKSAIREAIREVASLLGEITSA